MQRLRKYSYNNNCAIISVSLAVKAEQSAYVIDLSSVPCLSAHQYCGKTADWIRMPFGVVSGVGLGMVVIVEGEEAVCGGELVASHCNQWELCCVVV